MPLREAFIYIPGYLRILFYLLSLLSLTVFFIGLYVRFSLWLRGREDTSDFLIGGLTVSGLIFMSLRYFFSGECLFAKRVMNKSRLRAIMLILIYWGFTILFSGTVIVGIDHYLRLHILRGSFYLIFSLILDLSGFAVLIGCVFFISRRLFRSRALVSGWDDLTVLIIMAIIVLSGFMVEGARLSMINPLLMDLSPLGAAFAMILKGMGVNKAFYVVTWSFHVLSALLFIALIPFSKQFHMFAAQISTQDYLKRRENLRGLVHD